MPSRKPSNVLLMSATITPSANMPGSVRMDPAVRMRDYSEALKYYASLSDRFISGIVFLENSDTDLTPLKTALGKSTKKVEFISVSSNYPPERGKGYGEFKMFDEGLAVSSLIKRDDHVWKVTGRLKVLNMELLVAAAPEDYDVYCDLRKVPLIGERLGGNRWMELRIFAFRRSAYDTYFKGRYSQDFVLEKSFFEDMYRQVKLGNRKIVPRLNVQPIIDGYSGFSNSNYRSNGYIAKEKLRVFARRFIPHLWL